MEDVKPSVAIKAQGAKKNTKAKANVTTESSIVSEETKNESAGKRYNTRARKG